MMQFLPFRRLNNWTEYKHSIIIIFLSRWQAPTSAGSLSASACPDSWCFRRGGGSRSSSLGSSWSSSPWTGMPLSCRSPSDLSISPAHPLSRAICFSFLQRPFSVADFCFSADCFLGLALNWILWFFPVLASTWHFLLRTCLLSGWFWKALIFLGFAWE